MYKLSCRLLQIHKELRLMQKIPKSPHINKIISPSITKIQNFHSDKEHYNPENISKYSYKYILYLILFGTVSYTTYTIW